MLSMLMLKLMLLLFLFIVDCSGREADHCDVVDVDVVVFVVYG